MALGQKAPRAICGTTAVEIVNGHLYFFDMMRPEHRMHLDNDGWAFLQSYMAEYSRELRTALAAEPPKPKHGVTDQSDELALFVRAFAQPTVTVLIGGPPPTAKFFATAENVAHALRKAGAQSRTNLSFSADDAFRLIVFPLNRRDDLTQVNVVQDRCEVITYWVNLDVFMAKLVEGDNPEA